jgi:hypothetical protein
MYSEELHKVYSLQNLISCQNKGYFAEDTLSLRGRDEKF